MASDNRAYPFPQAISRYAIRHTSGHQCNINTTLIAAILLRMVAVDPAVFTNSGFRCLLTLLSSQIQVLQMRIKAGAAFVNTTSPSPTVKKLLKPISTATPSRASHSTPKTLVVRGADVGDPERHFSQISPIFDTRIFPALKGYSGLETTL